MGKSLSGGNDTDQFLVLGDMNLGKDADVDALCKRFELHEARYVGFSWGVKGNRFYDDMQYAGPGLRKDRVLFGKGLWVESHLLAQGKVFFDGEEFHLSDHFGVMAYVDEARVYASALRCDLLKARVRRREVLSVRDAAQQKELVENRSRLQRGRAAQAQLRQQVAFRDRAEFQRAQQVAARRRGQRRIALRRAAFGPDSFFAEGVVVSNASGIASPLFASDLPLLGFGDVLEGSWSMAIPAI